MLFVADEIPPELRRIIEFLNEQMDPAEVLAVEIKQYGGEGLRTLALSIVGQTEEAKQRKLDSAASSQQWDEERLLRELLTRHAEAEVATAQRILEWARARTTRVSWGKGQRSGSFVPIFNQKRLDYQLFAVNTLEPGALFSVVQDPRALSLQKQPLSCCINSTEFQVSRFPGARSAGGRASLSQRSHPRSASDSS